MKCYNIAVDLGNSLIKTSTGVCFDTKVEYELYDVHNEYKYKLDFDEKIQYIGQGKYLGIEDNKAYNESLLPFLLTALATSVEDNSFSVNLAVGLPVAQYKKKEDRNKLEDLIPVLQEVSFKLNGINKRILIRKLLICPEAVSAYFTLNIPEEEPVIMLDCGGKTTDACIIDGTFKNPISITKGILDIYSVIKAAIEEKFSTSLELEDISKIIERGYKKLNSKTGKLEKQDISFAIDKTKNIYRDILQEIKFKKYPLTEMRVIAIGGGASIIGPILKQAIPHLEINEDVFLNVNGYKILLDQKYSAN